MSKNKQETPDLGAYVIRMSRDYTNDRYGYILEIDEPKKRYKVRWVGRVITDKGKQYLLPWASGSHVRTWVRARELKTTEILQPLKKQL